MVMRRDGIVRATTKEIAREAGCSEALLYKHFPDKRDIFLHVLTERLPRVASASELAGSGTVVGNLEIIVGGLLEFYFESFPMAASIYGNTELLTAHRDAMTARGAGPHGPSRILTSYLDGEVELGRLPARDTDAIARLLTGGALHEAFLATYAGETITDPQVLARRLVAVLNLER